MLVSAAVPARANAVAPTQAGRYHVRPSPDTGPGPQANRLSDHGLIEADEYLETGVPVVYAMGEVKGGLAHHESGRMPRR
jgi:hypothetical protein